MEKLKAQDDIIRNINIFLENGLSGFNEYEDEEDSELIEDELDEVEKEMDEEENE